MIEHLSARYQLTTDTGMTFVYCNYKESRTTTTYIRLALKQLCRTMQSFPLELQQMYKLHHRNDSQPSYDELRNVFLAIIQQFDCIIFVLDALDECTFDQRKEICTFFSDIVEFNISSTSAHTPASLGNRNPTSRTVKLFVTSRKEPDIERVFKQKSFPKIEIEAAKVDSDIAVYVEAQIESRLQDHRLILRNIELKSKILTTLTAKAGGMYVFSCI